MKYLVKKKNTCKVQLTFYFLKNAIAAKKPATIEQASLENDVTSTAMKNKTTDMIAKTAAKSFFQCFLMKSFNLLNIYISYAISFPLLSVLAPWSVK